MADYTLAQAYVQVLPTTKGIKNNLEEELGAEGSKGGSAAGGKFAKAFGAAIGSAFGTVVAATAGLIKNVLDYYGEYEQLAGGIRKLYDGINPEEVLANADKAFATAQISANDYMQTVTSFSAALINSLGDDTSKAAAYADMAIIDMADNANTFGTSMESIQNAYQGFAKGQFNMLDNLKLGYGGTKTEMERLLEDAEKIKAANGEMVDYSIDNFADLVEAIHVVQDEMGIAGTSTKEAATTIQGSMNMLKASYKNLITGLGNADADVSQLASNMVESFRAVLKNVTPIIGQIAKVLPEAFKVMAEAIPSLINELLPPMVEGFIAIFEGIIDALPQILPVLLEAAIQLVMMLIEHIDEIVIMLIDMILSIVLAIAENLDTIIPAVVKGIIAIIVGLVQHIPEFLMAILTVLAGIFEGIFDLIVELGSWLFDKVLKPLADWLKGIWDAVMDWFVEVATAIADWFTQAWEDIKTWFTNLIDSIVEWFVNIYTSVSDWLVNTWNSIVDWFSNLIKSVVDWFKGIWQSISDWFSGLFNDLATWLSTTLSNIANWFTSLPGKVWNWMKQVSAIIGDWFSQKWEEFKNWGRNLVEGLWNGIKNAAEWVKNKIAGWVDDVLGFFKGILGIHSPSTLFAKEIGKYIPMGVAVGIEDNTDYATDAIEVMGEEISGSMSDVLTNIDNEILGTSLPESIAMNQDINNAISGRAILDSTLSMSESAEDRLNRIIDLLEMYFPLSLEKNIVLDTGQTVGALIGEIDKQLGTLNNLKARGAYV